MSVFVPTVGRSTGNVTTASSLPSEPLGGRMIADQRRSVDDSRATYGEPTASPCPGCSSRATVLDRGAKGIAGGEGQVSGEVVVDAGFTGAKPERPPGDLPDEGRTTAAVTVPAVSTMPAVTRSQRGGRAGDRLGPPSNSSVMRLVVRRTHGSRGRSGSRRWRSGWIRVRPAPQCRVRFAVEEVPFRSGSERRRVAFGFHVRTRVGLDRSFDVHSIVVRRHGA